MILRPTKIEDISRVIDIINQAKTYLKNNDFQIQRTYHIVMHKDKKLLPLYQEIFELIKKE